MLWLKKYQPPPPSWTVRKLTDWDCSKFSCHATPITAWIVEGPVDAGHLTKALEATIRRRAPWLGGRIARTESGNPPYEVHVPPASDRITPVVARTVEDKRSIRLHSLVPYVAAGHPQPVVDSTTPISAGLINPVNIVKGGVEGYINGNLPPINLHFLRAADATLISISWSHVIMDAVAAGQIVSAWEDELSGHASNAPSVHQPEDTYAFTKDIKLEEGWLPPQWFTPGMLDFAKLAWGAVTDLISYPNAQGSLYIPKRIVEAWENRARKELGDGKFVSRVDLTTAWIFKHAYASYPDKDTNILVAAVNLRGRHPALPRTLIGNTPTAYIPPPFTSRHLRETTLSFVAYALRESLMPYLDEDFVAKRAAYEVRILRKGTTVLPFGSSNNRFCILSTWAKCGVTSPNFGEGLKTLCCIPYNSQANFPGIVTTVDDEAGGWRLGGKMKKAAWDDMKAELEREAKALEA